MTRDDIAAFVAARFGVYLSAAARGTTDAAGGLATVIDDALRALGVADADLATEATVDALDGEDVRVQVAYRAMSQIVRDLGGIFNLSTAGDSFSLYQMRQSAEKDLAEAKAAVLERFGTLGAIPSGSDSPFVVIDTNYLEDTYAEWAEAVG